MGELRKEAHIDTITIPGAGFCVSQLYPATDFVKRKHMVLVQDGPLPIINGVRIPKKSRVITSVTHLICCH